MQAILLCAGKSSRFHPFTGQHKSLTTLFGKPLVLHTIEKLKQVGIKEFIVVIGPEDSGSASFQSLLGDGSSYGIEVLYVEEREQLGMGKAVDIAGSKIKGDFLVLNPYHVNVDQQLRRMLEAKQHADGVLLYTQTSTPERYGILSFNDDSSVASIIEKPLPTFAPSDKRLIGIYLLPKVFLSYIQQVSVADDQFEQALSLLFGKHTIVAVEAEAEPITLKYAWHILDIKEYLCNEITEQSISEHAFIAPTASIEGNVIIREGARIFDYAIIKGPCYIGKNAVIGSHTLIRDGACLEEGANVGCFTEVRNSCIGAKSSFHSGFIGDSIIGEGCKVGANFCTANKRIDRGNISTLIKGEKVSTGRKNLGVIMGESCGVGIHSGTMPGVILSNNSVITPGSMVTKNS